MRISDWSSDVCSPDLVIVRVFIVVVLGSPGAGLVGARFGARVDRRGALRVLAVVLRDVRTVGADVADRHRLAGLAVDLQLRVEFARSEEHTSELQSLMRISYAVFCL